MFFVECEPVNHTLFPLKRQEGMHAYFMNKFNSPIFRMQIYAMFSCEVEMLTQI